MLHYTGTILWPHSFFSFHLCTSMRESKNNELHYRKSKHFCPSQELFNKSSKHDLKRHIFQRDILLGYQI